MTDLVTDLVAQSAFDQVERLKKSLEDALKVFNQLASTNLNVGGGGGKGSTAGLSEMAKLQQQILTLQERLDVAYLKEKETLVQLQAQQAAWLEQQKQGITIMPKLDGSINSMTAQMKNLEKQIRATADAQGQGSEKIKQLTAEYNLLNKQVSAHEQAMGNFKRNVGNYASAYNGMSIAISQIAREMPNFAQSVQIGVMSLTNNIGGLVDGYKGLVEQNRILAAQNQATIPIWKGVTSAILSWNTLIMVGVTLITAFMPKITAWVEKLMQANNFQKELNSATAQGIKNAQSEITHLDSLYKSATNVNLSMAQRKKASQELLDMYPKSFKAMSDEEIALGKAKKQYDELKDSIIKVAKAKAYESAITKLVSDGVDEEMRLMEKIKEARANMLLERGQGGTRIIGTSSSGAPISENVSGAEMDIQRRAALNNAQMELDVFRDTQNKKVEVYQSMIDRLGIIDDDYNKKTKKKKEKGYNRIDAIEAEYKARKLAIEKQTLDETEFRVKMIELDKEFFKERANLNKEEKESEVKFNLHLLEEIKSNVGKLKADAEKVFGEDYGGVFYTLLFGDSKKGKKKAQDEFNNTLQDYQDKIADLIDYIQLKQKQRVDKLNEKKEAQGKIKDSVLDIEATAIDVVIRKLNEKYATEFDLIDEREKRETDSLARMTMSDNDRTEKKIQLELKYEAQRKKLHREQISDLRRAAIFQKALDIGVIIANVAKAITAHLTSPWMIAADVAVGAAQTARILAQPLPQYAKGTDNHKGGAAIVGEEGTELGILPSGKTFLTKNKATLMNLPAKTKIIPHDKLVQMIYNNAIMKMSEMGGVQTTDGMQDALIASVSDLGHKMERIEDAILGKDMSLTLVGDAQKYVHLSRQLR